jgi:hypothetical protein
MFFFFGMEETEEVTNSVLPFHSIEHIDEARMELAAQTDLFSLDAKGRQDKGWTNKLIWGDNKLNVYINKYLYIFVQNNKQHLLNATTQRNYKKLFFNHL